MGVVTWMVETTDSYLDGAAETTFGTVASQVGGIIAVGSTLAVIGVFVNMALQVRSMDGRTAFWFAIKLTLITLSRSTGCSSMLSPAPSQTGSTSSPGA